MNTLKIFLVFLISGLILMAADCGKGKPEGPNCHHDIHFMNNSNSLINFNFSTSYPDTTIDCKTLFGQATPGQKVDLSAGAFNCWEQRFSSLSIIQIFVIDTMIQSNINLTCDSIKKNSLVLKHYKLSLKDIQSMNWTITYP